MHVETFDAKVNEIQWKLLPIGFQSVYQRFQIEKGFAGFSLQAAVIFFYYKDSNYKTEDLAFACIQAQGLPQLSLKLMPLFVGNAFGSSAKVFCCKRLKCLTALSNMKWFTFKSVVTQAGKVEIFCQFKKFACGCCWPID